MLTDGYRFDLAYQRALREGGVGLAVIDDFAHLGHYHADLLLNQNGHACAEDYPGAEQLLLRPTYALLGPSSCRRSRRTVEHRAVGRTVCW